MKGYLSIGAVSKAKNVSIKSLRYYDHIGILTPAYINPKTNYRYYTEDQLYLLDAISLCLDLGIPLKDFEKYRDEKSGQFNLRTLLYDGKELAENHIKTIRGRLETLQHTIDIIENPELKKAVSSENIQSGISETVNMQAEASEAQAESSDADDSVDILTESSDTDDSADIQAEVSDDGFFTRETDGFYILTSPYSPEDSENDSQKILRLFMLAQLLGMNASYPSGILYEYKDNQPVNTSIFVNVSQCSDCHDKRLRYIPEGTLLCKKGTSHPVASVSEINAALATEELPSLSDSFMIMETNYMENDIEVKELQVLI